MSIEKATRFDNTMMCAPGTVVRGIMAAEAREAKTATTKKVGCILDEYSGTDGGA